MFVHDSNCFENILESFPALYDVTFYAVPSNYRETITIKGDDANKALYGKCLPGSSFY